MLKKALKQINSLWHRPRRSVQWMEGCSTITWCPVSFWMVNVSGTDHLKAHGSSDVCSELTQATHCSRTTDRPTDRLTDRLTD